MGFIEVFLLAMPSNLTSSFLTVQINSNDLTVLLGIHNLKYYFFFAILKGEIVIEF